MGIYKFIAKKLVPILLVSSMSLCLSVPAMAAEEKEGESSNMHAVSIDYAPLTDDERKALIREEMERLLGPDAVYCMYFGDEDTNGIMPINDIDEYKTEYSPIKSVSISGKPGGVLEASLSVSGPSDQTYYLGWTYTDAGGPSVSKGISFAHPFKFITVSLSLGMVSNTDNYGIEFGINDAKPGVKYKVTEVTKTYDVQEYIIYKKVYNDAGSYTWEEWSGGKTETVTNRNFKIVQV